MPHTIQQFFDDTSGAVTVDWTVLAAAIVGLGASSVAAVRLGVVSLGDDVSTSLSGASVAPLGELGAGVPGFEPIYYTQGQLDSFVDYYTGYVLTSDDDLVRWLRSEATLARDGLDSGSPDPYRIETAYIYRQALIGRGAEIPADIADVDQMYRDYRATLP